LKFVYLVAHVDTTTKPPRITGTGLYSEPAKSLTGAIMKGRFAFDVQVASGSNFEKAKRNLLNMLNTDIGRLAYGWALDMLPEHMR
jgi:hypothetical protein